MKRILTLIFVMVLALSVLAGCKGVSTSGTTTSSTTTSSTTAPVDEDLQAAYDYIKLTYKTLSTTDVSFELMKSAPIGDKIFDIVWTTNNEAITITEDGDFYVVNVPALGAEAINYVLSFTIQNEAGETKEGSFNLTVPVASVNTHAQYVAAEDGDRLTVQGIVTGVISKTGDYTKENSLFLQDLSGNGGYYIYNIEEDPTDLYKVGMTVEVKGEKKNYNGTFELINATVTVIDSTIKTVTPVDITEALIAAGDVEAKALTDLNGMLATIKGVTLLEYNEGNGYHNFKLGELKSYLRVSSSSNCISKNDGKTLTATFQDNFYNAADVTGLIAVYNGALYLMPVSVDAFTNFVEQDKPADVKVDITLANTTLPGMIQVAGTTALPTTFSGFSDVTISWELVDGADVATLNGSNLVVTIPAEAKTVKVKATATCGTVSDTKEYAITVKPISTITIQEALNIGDLMAHNTYTEELYYIVGTIDSIVSDVYGNLYLVDSGLSIYIYGLYDSTGKVRYDSMDVKPLKKDTIKVLSTVGKYSNDVQLKNAKVIEHTIHPDNVVEVAPEVPFAPVNPIVGTEFFFGMTKNEKVYYITGAMNGYYMTTSLKQAEAAKVTVLAGPTADTYYLTVTVGGATKYLDLVLSGTHKNAVYADAAPEVGFSYDADAKVFYKELDSANYTFGTALSNTFTTVGGVKVDAANAMCQISFAEEHTHTAISSTIVPPACEVAGYTSNVCACGETFITDPVAALEHIWDAQGECTQEGCDASNHTHTYDEVVTPPTCTAAGYTTFTCTVPGCTKTYTEAGEAALGHAYTDGVCANGCGIEDPNYYYPMTVAEALTAPVNKKVTLTGTISGIKSAWDTGYKNMEAWLSDGTGEILLYRIKTLVVVGDKVTVTGVIGSYNEVNQIAQSGSTVTITEKHVCSEFTEATCEVLAKCVVCGAETGEKAEHTMVNGVCTVCGHEEGAAEAVELKLSFASKDNRTTFTTSQQVWEQNGIKLTNDKGSSTSNVADYSNPARFYKSSKITVAVAGKQITKIVFNCNTSSYATALKSSIPAATGVTVSVSGSAVTVEFAAPVDSFVIASLTGGQVRINDMTVFAL